MDQAGAMGTGLLRLGASDLVPRRPGMREGLLGMQAAPTQVEGKSRPWKRPQAKVFHSFTHPFNKCQWSPSSLPGPEL